MRVFLNVGNGIKEPICRHIENITIRYLSSKKMLAQCRHTRPDDAPYYHFCLGVEQGTKLRCNVRCIGVCFLCSAVETVALNSFVYNSGIRGASSPIRSSQWPILDCEGFLLRFALRENAEPSIYLLSICVPVPDPLHRSS